jgi:putative ABC transport system permease protein
MGGTPGTLYKLLLLEGGLLSLGGTILGLLISRIGLLTLASAVENKFQYDLGNLGLLTSEIYLALGATFVGLIAAALPAFKTLRLDISKTLSSE